MSKGLKIFSVVGIVIIAAGAVALAYKIDKEKFPTPHPTDQNVAVQMNENANVPEENANTNTNTPTATPSGFGNDVAYSAPDAKIDPAVSKDFNVDDIKNIADMEKAYGFKFSAAELKMLASDKFVIKDLTDTSIRPSSGRWEDDREFSDLYSTVSGPSDYKARAPQNAVFYSADVFTNAYNNIYTELLKEMENTVFYPAMTDLSEQFYKAADAHLASATTASDKNKWTKIRNYFAVPNVNASEAATPTGGVVDVKTIVAVP